MVTRDGPTVSWKSQVKENKKDAKSRGSRNFSVLRSSWTIYYKKYQKPEVKYNGEFHFPELSKTSKFTKTENLLFFPGALG